MKVIPHLYQRSIKKDGEVIKCWYYWYRDENGKQIRKSCGQAGKPCLTKKAAQQFIAELPDDFYKVQAEKERLFIKNLYPDMFERNSLYMKKRAAKGREIVENTRKIKVRSLKLFMDEFGDVEVTSLKPVEIEDWLLSFDRSNSWKNGCLQTINEWYMELYNRDIVKYPVQVAGFKRPNVSKKGILTLQEIKTLFPDDTEELKKIWAVTENESKNNYYQYVTMTYIILSTGMRSGEARALQYNQFIKDDTILLNAAIDTEGERKNLLKKGKEDNKKWRLVFLSEKAVKMLQKHKSMQFNTGEDDYLFIKDGVPVLPTYINSRFRRALTNIGVDWEERDISIHSLRFTYNSLMRREISESDLRLMMGHTDEKMTDYYDKSSVLDHLPELEKNKAVINSVWN